MNKKGYKKIQFKKLFQDEAEATVVFDWENGYAECSAKENINIQECRPLSL